MAGMPDELCHLIADHFCTIQRDWLDFQNIRVVDELTYVLFKAGLIAPVSGDADQFYPLKRGHPIAGSSLSEESKRALLNAAIGVAGDVENIPVPRKRWFRVSGRNLDFMKIMAAFGYADHHNDKFRWTDKIEPTMQAACFWDKRGRSVDDGPAFD
jgi:hypothetical protein